MKQKTMVITISGKAVGKEEVVSHTFDEVTVRRVPSARVSAGWIHFDLHKRLLLHTITQVGHIVLHDLSEGFVAKVIRPDDETRLIELAAGGYTTNLVITHFTVVDVGKTLIHLDELEDGWRLTCSKDLFDTFEQINEIVGVVS